MAQLVPGKEYEKKFLVRVNEMPRGLLKDGQELEQGYLCLSPQIRVRLIGSEGVLELKGDKNIEVELGRMPLAEGRRWLREHASRIASIITKERFEIPAGFDGLKWEIDFFRGENEGLVIAELETPRKKYGLKRKHRPAWLGREVTKDARFKNKNLAQHPFGDWPQSDKEQIFKLMGV